jgi:deoxyribose-phosphate aldolase
MDINKILSYCDHTLLKVDATWEEIKETCDDGIKYGAASVCIPASYVKQAAEYVDGKIAICTVVGFPNGYSTTATKAFEAGNAIENGASEIDMVINVGWVKDGRYEDLLNSIKIVKAACGDKILKVIIETCLLTDEEKIKMCKIVAEAGADFIKTSTGFSKYGATKEDVGLLAQYLGDDLKMKAAGGIHSFEDAEYYINLGCDRLGTSALVKLAKKQEVNGY